MSVPATAAATVSYRAPSSVPQDLVELWHDPTWRDHDATTRLRLRAEVVSALRTGSAQPASTMMSAGLFASAFGVAAGLVAASARGRRGRSSRRKGSRRK